MTVPAYPKIFHIGERYIPNLLKDNIEITEKVDGSQFSFGKDSNGELCMRSKGQDLSHVDYQNFPAMFKDAYNQVMRMTCLDAVKDTFFYCEYLNKPKHNVLKYDRVPRNNLYLFAVLKRGEFVSDTIELFQWADLLEIERPNVLALGNVVAMSPDFFVNDFLELDSVLGGTKIEGIVIKNYHYPAQVGDLIIPISAGKFVSEVFKEKHQKDWSTMIRQGGIQAFIEGFRAEARWNKAIQHLAEQGQILGSPKDIGSIIKEVHKDILEEETDYIKESLFSMIKGDIMRKSIAGLPEWYKMKLASGVQEKGYE